jgi:hypothetical protein
VVVAQNAVRGSCGSVTDVDERLRGSLEGILVRWFEGRGRGKNAHRAVVGVPFCRGRQRRGEANEGGLV